MQWRLDGERLWWGDQPVADDDVRGFEERFDARTGQLVLRVRGAEVEAAVGPAYGQLRAGLRRLFPELPFVSSWRDGSFPGGWYGSRRRRGAAVALVSLVGVACLGLWGVVPAITGGVLAGWLAVRSAPRVRLTRRGMAAGPPWAPLVPWHEVVSVQVRRADGVARVAVRGHHSWHEGEVPEILLPALRARLRRLGGLDLVPLDDEVERTYQRLRAPLWGGTWGLAIGAVAGSLVLQGAPVIAAPLAAGLVVCALLALAVEARASGWGAGAVGALSLLYAAGALWAAWP